MKSKLNIIISTLFFLPLICTAQDAIIFRDGRIKSVKIVQSNNDKTLYKTSDKKDAEEEYVDNKTIFMLKFKTRGNVVFNNKGERILSTSEAAKLPKDAIIIYFKNGREVPAYNLTMDQNNITFKKTRKKGDGYFFIPKKDIFMVVYPDGTRDILTDLIAEEQREREAEEARLKAQKETEEAEKAKKEAEEEVIANTKNPQKATIITKKGVRMKVWVCADDGTTVSYKKADSPKAAIFKMSKSRIKSINY